MLDQVHIPVVLCILLVDTLLLHQVNLPADLFVLPIVCMLNHLSSGALWAQARTATGPFTVSRPRPQAQRGDGYRLTDHGRWCRGRKAAKGA